MSDIAVPSITHPGVSPSTTLGNDLAPVSTREATLAIFESFRQILDDQNDRYERLVKLSRDLTIQSKRIIFLLHRVAGSGAEASERAPPPDSTEIVTHEPSDITPARAVELNAARQARQKFEALKPLFSKMSAELKDQEAERYNRAMLVPTL